MKSLVVFGSGGHAKVILDIAEKMAQYKILGVFDDGPTVSSVFEYKVLGNRTDLQKLAKETSDLEILIAIGNNSIRREIANWCRSQNIKLATLIHPSSQVARNVKIGSGTVIMAGTVINSDTTIGEDVILNTRSSVDHDCKIASGVHIAPGVTLCGGVEVGENSLLGVGSQVIPKVVVGKNVIVGAGSTVTKSTVDGVTLVGSPAKRAE